MSFGLNIYIKNKRWRKINSENNTYIESSFIQNNVSVGKYTYGPLFVEDSGSEKYKLKIGCFCSIATGVHFILNAEHDLKLISTFPFKYFFNGKMESYSKGDIIVGDDVWFGDGSKILSGIHIGQGAVIAAGAVVTKDVEPYSIVGGVPARFIRKRFSDDMISELLKIDYSKLTENMIKKHIEELYAPLESIDQISWMLKK